MDENRAQHREARQHGGGPRSRMANRDLNASGHRAVGKSEQDKLRREAGRAEDGEQSRGNGGKQRKGGPKNLPRAISRTYAAAVARISRASIAVCRESNTRNIGAPKPKAISACITIAAAEMTRLTSTVGITNAPEVQRRVLTPVDPCELPRNLPRIAESLH